MALAQTHRLVAILVLLIVGSGPSLQPTVTVAAPVPSVENVYARLQAKLAASGKVYHVVVSEKDSGSASRAPRKEQVWVDAAHNVARQLVVYSGREFIDIFYRRQVTVEALRSPSQGGRPVFGVSNPFPTCHGAGLVPSLLIGCPLYLEREPMGASIRTLDRSTVTEKVLMATYGRKPAIVLQVQGTISDEDGTLPSTAKLYLNPTTFLPIARLTTTTGFASGIQTTLATFAVSSVNPSAFPRNFFDPASLGYRGVDAVMRANLAQMPHGFPVYWLGMHWKGTSVFSPLAVNSAERERPNTLHMAYAPEGNRFGLSSTVVYFSEVQGGSGWPWPLPSGPCVSQQQIALSGGYGIIASPRTGSGCTGGGRLAAVAAFGDLKIFVDPVIRLDRPQQRTRYRAYNTVAGLTAVLKALVRR